MPRLVHPNKRRPFKAVVMDTEMPESKSEALNSLLVVSSLLCIKFSMDCKAAEGNLVGRPDLGSGLIVLYASKRRRICHTVCLQVRIPSRFSKSTVSATLARARRRCNILSLTYNDKRGWGGHAELTFEESFLRSYVLTCTYMRTDVQD